MPICVVQVCEIVRNYLPRLVNELHTANKLKATEVLLYAKANKVVLDDNVCGWLKNELAKK